MAGPNRLKRLLADGAVACGATTQIPAPALVEILGLAGFDFTMIDTEHGLYDLETAGELIRAARGANLTPIVRVLHNDPALITKALDLGAQGVVVPHIRNRDDAARAVEACIYGPRGRGACPYVRAANYGLSSWAEYQVEANQETMVFLLIEDLESTRQMSEILSVDGVDVVFPGPFDMSVSAGYGGNVAHPEVQAAVERVFAAGLEAGVPVMCAMAGGGSAQAWVDKGARLILQSADSAVFARACRAFLDSVSHLRTRRQE